MASDPQSAVACQGLQFWLKLEVGENQNNKNVIGQFERTLLFSLGRILHQTFAILNNIQHLLAEMHPHLKNSN